MITLGELINENKNSFPNCERAGLSQHRHYNMYFGMTIDAGEVEKVLERLYNQIDNLTTAYDEAIG